MFFPYPETLGHRAYYARAECSPCDRDRCDDLRCLKRLTVEGAWDLLSAMLARTHGPRGPSPGPAPHGAGGTAAAESAPGMHAAL
jgi:hypothetical protein